MTALKARDVTGFLQRPDLKSGIILIYGPDAGRVRETTDQLQRHFQGKDADPMNLISLQYADLDNADATIETEANTSSMFGGQRIVRVRGATNALAPTLERLADENVPAIILVEAGNLTPKDKLRKVLEKAKSARALPCFADDARSLDQLMREMFRENQVQIDNDALQALKDQLGNDRQITRSEVEKLILFAAHSKKKSRSKTSCFFVATTPCWPLMRLLTARAPAMCKSLTRPSPAPLIAAFTHPRSLRAR